MTSMAEEQIEKRAEKWSKAERSEKREAGKGADVYTFV
jgi:hypothetical protein